jgi:asparagine synthase (glutamine-hydrolysing)
MCGISGMLSRSAEPADRQAVEAMADSLDHRGPDGRGYFFDDAAGIALAHNRLKILDLSELAHQPMLSGDGRWALDFNGEIYNYRSLRDELTALGHTFRSTGDTEVVLNAWMQWGCEALTRFDGMFAIAMWDGARSELTLARDALGMKPLYYTDLPAGGGLAFASEIKAFLVIPGFRAVADRHSVRQFLEFGYVFDEEATAMAGVKKLPPAHFLVVKEGLAGRPRRYWALPAVDTTEDPSRRREALFETLRTVVREHMEADVPVGFLLSGGLDSSLIAALAARDRTITTFTMGFTDSALDERTHGRTMSRFIGSQHHEVTISQSEVRDELAEAVWAFDDLFADWGVVSTRMLYRKARELGLKVVLVGEGSDEVFGGYSQFADASRWTGPDEFRIFRLSRRYSGQRVAKEMPAFRTIMRGYLKECGGDLFEAVRRFEAERQLPNNYVMKVDKASMSVSVEARTPYLDRRVVSAAFRTPRGELLAGGTEKKILRDIAAEHRLLPPEIATRRKMGGSMAASWMDDLPEFRSFAREAILAEGSWTDTLGFRPAMTDFFDRGKEGYPFPHPISIFRNLAWKLLLLNLWSDRYLGRGAAGG